jgi:hypothetical protein
VFTISTEKQPIAPPPGILFIKGRVQGDGEPELLAGTGVQATKWKQSKNRETLLFFRPK